jgi:hypothetical protein
MQNFFCANPFAVVLEVIGSINFNRRDVMTYRYDTRQCGEIVKI